MQKGTLQKKFYLKPLKRSEVPIKTNWKIIVAELVDEFSRLPEMYVEVLPITSKEDMKALYETFKSFIKRNKLRIDVITKNGRLFLIKEMRYFVK